MYLQIYVHICTRGNLFKPVICPLRRVNRNRSCLRIEAKEGKDNKSCQKPGATARGRCKEKIGKGF